MPRPTLVRVAIFVATVVAAWGVLSLGTGTTDPELIVGAPAPREYRAQRQGEVIDTAETERLRQEARDAVEPIEQINEQIESTVNTAVTSVFDDVQALVIGDAVDPPAPSATEAPSLPADEVTTETTTAPPEPALLTGSVFLDVNTNGEMELDTGEARSDIGVDRLPVTVQVGDETFDAMTDANGVWSAEVPAGVALVSIDPAHEQIPDGYVVGSPDYQQLVECGSGDACTALSIPFQVNLRPVEEVIARVTAQHTVASDAIATLALTASDDVIRAALGETPHFPIIRQAAVDRLFQEFGLRITPDQLSTAQQRLRSNPPQVVYLDTNPPGPDEAASDAAGEIVASLLQANYLVDEAATEEARVEAAEAVPDVVVEYFNDQLIVAQGVPVEQLHIDAIAETTSAAAQAEADAGLLAVLAVTVGALGLYLSRFRPEFWSRPRMMALLGILLVLAAGSVRATVVFQATLSWYILPAVAFGFMTAILFDSRIAVLMALAVGVLAAAGTQDTGVAVYAALATMAPIPFVSSVSSRGAFRTAVVMSAAAAAVIAGATSWYFHAGPTDVPVDVMGVELGMPLIVMGQAMAWAFGVSAIASLIGLAALQFFESAFDITTNLSLLDLTDRNHEALQLLQEKAFGTFNHSLMVGTLAHAAARAIGANALLARAMAYYHDLGKTENPTMFIENQFGIQNPHDFLTPEESAEAIRRHVSDGIALAKQFKIPSDVATGIVTHHGDGIMRFFYEKARSQRGDGVNPHDFRHVGHKPTTAETAIVMLSDSLEAACRANFQTEEPTPEAIEKVVSRVIDEKLNDGQLSESPLTLAEMTLIRSAFLDSLVGHYHQRIAYPNFPGS
jgi:putative nucleotidyltransferase with HDIG domain